MTPAVLPLPCSVIDHVALARGQLGGAIVAPAAWRQLEAISEPLPALAEEGALEVRLERGDPRVDFAVCVRADRRRSLAGTVARSHAPRCSLGWRRVLAFAQAWASEASPLHAAVHAVWLEFDAGGRTEPEPFLLFSLDEERLYAGGTATPEALLAPLRTGIARLAGREPDVMAAVERCVRGLPRWAQLRHVALRPTPDGDVVRLVVRLPRRRLPGALVELGWRGDPAELQALLEVLRPEALVHPVNLDVLPDGLGPRVGIEFVQLGAPRESPRWQALFDALEALGACAAERRAAIEGWGGELLGPALGPGRLCLRRDLMVKVIHEPGAPPRAKAYLAFAPRLVAIEARAEATLAT